jgi:CIC family chloride channel protein
LDDGQLKSVGRRRLFAMAILIGLLAGVAAWAFRLLIGLIHNLAFFGQFSTHYDANLHTSASSWGWLVIFVPVIGGIVVTWLIKNFAPEAKGHGVPEVMAAIHYQRGRIRGVVSVAKAIASAITIGTGGSLGREGPIVQISAAFSSVLGQWMKWSVSQRNLLIACGASGGIAATFNAPLGGILFSIELLLLSLNSSTVLPVIVSSVIAANLGRYLIGPDPAFHVPVASLEADVHNPLTLALYFPFGAVMGLVALVFIKGIYWSENWFESLPLGPYRRHMLGMLALGLLFYGLHRWTGHYYVQGVGYATIQDILWGTLSSPMLMLLLLGAKLLATFLTIGSGGSGGVFSPSLYLGATAGGFFGTALAALFPGMGIDPLTMALTGMAAMVAATTSAPMTAAIMTYEMTLDYVVVLPIMLGVATAYSVRRHFSKGDIYTLKLIRRGQPVPHGFHADVSSQIVLNDMMDSTVRFAHADDIVTGGDETYCILGEDNKAIGVVNPVSYRNGLDFRAQDAMRTDFIPIKSGTMLREALREMDKHSCATAVVTTDGSLDADAIIGVFNSVHLQRVMAEVWRMRVHA